MGSVIALVGFMGPVSVAILQVTGRVAPAYPPERWIGSISWLIGGIILVLAAKPIGRRLGGGLE